MSSCTLCTEIKCKGKYKIGSKRRYYDIHSCMDYINISGNSLLSRTMIWLKEKKKILFLRLEINSP